MSHHTLLHRCVRPGVRRLARNGATPNQLTTLRLATGLLAAAAFAQGSQPWVAAGAGLLVVSMLLDRADGELARQTGKSTPWGYRYDLVSDAASTVAVFVGMGVGARSTYGVLSLLLGLVGAGGVVALFALMQALRAGRPASSAPKLIDPDDALLLAPILVWSGMMALVVLITAVVTPALALILLGVWAHRRASERAGGHQSARRVAGSSR